MGRTHICRVISCSKEASVGTSLHWIPKNDVLANWWLCFLEMANEFYINFSSSTRLVICSNHFKSISNAGGSVSSGKIQLARGHIPCLLNGVDYTDEITRRMAGVTSSAPNYADNSSFYTFVMPVGQRNSIALELEQPTTTNRMVMPMTISQHRSQILVKMRQIERMAKGIEKVTANIRKMIEPRKTKQSVSGHFIGQPLKRTMSVADANAGPAPASKKMAIECITIV